MAKNKIIVADSKRNKRIVQPSMIPAGFRYVKDYKESEKDFSELSKSKLNDKLKKDLQAYLDNKNVEYDSDATKDELIDLIVGE